MTDPHSVTRRGFLGSLSAGGIMAGPTLLHFAQVTDSEPQVASSYRLIKNAACAAIFIRESTKIGATTEFLQEF